MTPHIVGPRLQHTPASTYLEELDKDGRLHQEWHENHHLDNELELAHILEGITDTTSSAGKDTS